MMNSWKHPKIKIAKTKSERVWNIVGYMVFISMIVLTIAVWNTLPAEVPGHYNALGEVDRWGSKWELLILIITGLFILLLMEPLDRYPEVHNYPNRLNETNAPAFYLNSRKMLNQLKNICLISFSMIQFESIMIAMMWGNGFGAWFLPIFILGVFIPIIHGIIKQRKIQ